MKMNKYLKLIESVDEIKILNLDFVLSKNGNVETYINTNSTAIFKDSQEILKCIRKISQEIEKRILKELEELEQLKY